MQSGISFLLQLSTLPNEADPFDICSLAICIAPFSLPIFPPKPRFYPETYWLECCFDSELPPWGMKRHTEVRELHVIAPALCEWVGEGFRGMSALSLQVFKERS